MCTKSHGFLYSQWCASSVQQILISAGASQGTVLGTEEEAKTTGVSRRETRLLPRPLGGAAGEASGCRKGRTQGTPVELRTVSFPSCVSPSLPSSTPLFSFCFFSFFLSFIFERNCLGSVPTRARSPVRGLYNLPLPALPSSHF